MAEDAQELPSPAWHLELDRELASADQSVGIVAVDLTEMDWLVGQDWGFLVRMSERAKAAGRELVVVASERVIKASKVIALDGRFRVLGRLDDAL